MADHPAVLVVGAGPTGLVFAAELARRDVVCRLIERRTQPDLASKAVGIWARTLERFEDLGVIDRVLVEGHQLQGGNFYSAGCHLARVGFARLPSRYRFGLTLAQPRTEAVLTDRLATLGVAIERGAELLSLSGNPDGAVHARLRHGNGWQEELESDWVVGCDGAHSTVRHELGVAFEGRGYPETLLLADAVVDARLEPTEGHFFLSPEGLVVLVPVPGGRFRVTADIPADADITHEAGIAVLEALLRARALPEASLSDPTWVSEFRISARVGRTFRAGRGLLIGDAAHVHSPAGGQGMNCGIVDAATLATVLASVIRQEQPSSALDDWAAERRATARRVVRSTTIATRAGLARRWPTRTARDAALRLAGRTALLDRILAPKIAGTS